MVKKISHYGPTDVVVTLPLRGSDGQTTRSTPSLKSTAVQLVPQPQLISQPSQIASAYQQRSELEKRSPSETPVSLLPQRPRICRSCGHVGHDIGLCPVLFYTDANNDLHIDWSGFPWL